LYRSYKVPALDDVAGAEGEGDISGIEHLAAIKLASVVNLDVIAGLRTSAGRERKERKGHAGMRECIPYCIERVQKILRANAVLRQRADTQHRRHYKTYRGSLARTLLHGCDLEAASKGFGLTQEDRSALAGIAGHQHKGRHKAQGRRACQNLERQSACAASAPPIIGQSSSSSAPTHLPELSDPTTTIFGGPQSLSVSASHSRMPSSFANIPSSSAKDFTGPMSLMI